MSLLGILLGGPGPAAPPPEPPAPTAGSTPVVATDAGGGAGSAANRDTGSSPGGTSSGAAPSGSAPTAQAAASPPAVSGPLPTGTPLTAPATRHAFSLPEDPLAPEEREQAYAMEHQRRWRMADVVAAISGGPRAQILIEAASRPGPVEPGSLLEAIKALHPAPTMPQSTRTV